MSKPKLLEERLISLQTESNTVIPSSKENVTVPIQSPGSFTLRQALKDLSFDSLPTFVFYLSNLLIWTFNLYYAGLHGDSALTSAVGLTNTWMGATIFYIIFGLNIGTTALCSQALGAGHCRGAGFIFHRALIMRLIIAALLYPLQFFAVNMFHLFGVDKIVAQDAGIFCRCQIGVVVLIVIYDTLKSLLMANGIYTPFIFIQIIGIVAHWFLLLLFVDKLSMGVLGFCAAMTCTYLILVLLLIGYIRVTKACEESLFFFRRESYHGILHQLREELPIGAILYLDFAAEQMSVMLSGVYPQDQLAAQILNYNVISIMTLMPLGLNSTLTTYIGNAIGESNIVKLRKFIGAGLILSGLLYLIQAPILFFFCRNIASIFTRDPSVLDLTTTVLKIYAIASIADFIQLVMSSILRGIGKEKIACLIFVAGNYMIGLPAGIVMGTILKGYTKGMFIGIVIGMVFNAIATTIATLTVDLEHQSERISLKIEKKMKIGKLASSFASVKSNHSLNSSANSLTSGQIEFNI